MIDLTKIKIDNAARRATKARAQPAPWTIYTVPWTAGDRSFIAFARNDNVEDVIDALVEEIERERTVLLS